MVMKKITLVGAFLLTCPWMASAEVAQQQQQHQQHQQQVSTEGLDLVSLRTICKKFEDDSQIMPFKIKVQCRGSHTYWEHDIAFFSLAKNANMTFHASTKDNRYDTVPGSLAKALAAHPGTCNIYTQKEVSVGAGFQVELNKCDELEENNIIEICEHAVDEYCEDNVVPKHAQQQQQQQQQQSQAGACTVETLQVKDTCPSYK